MRFFVCLFVSFLIYVVSFFLLLCGVGFWGCFFGGGGVWFFSECWQAVYYNNNNYNIDRHIYLNLSKAIPSAAGLLSISFDCLLVRFSANFLECLAVLSKKRDHGI